MPEQTEQSEECSTISRFGRNTRIAGLFHENEEGSDGYSTGKQHYAAYQRASVPKGDYFTVSL